MVESPTPKLTLTLLGEFVNRHSVLTPPSFWVTAWKAANRIADEGGYALPEDIERGRQAARLLRTPIGDIVDDEEAPEIETESARAVSPKYEQVGWLNEVGSFIDKTWADTHGKSDVYDSDWDRLYRRLEN